SPATDTAADPTGQSGSVVVTTDHGEVVEFHNFDVSCPDDTSDEWGRDADIVYAVASVGGTPPNMRRDPVMTITAGADVADGTTLSLPYSEVYGRGKTFVMAFITRAGRTTELSAGAEESSGRIEISW